MSTKILKITRERAEYSREVARVFRNLFPTRKRVTVTHFRGPGNSTFRAPKKVPPMSGRRGEAFHRHRTEFPDFFEAMTGFFGPVDSGARKPRFRDL